MKHKIQVIHAWDEYNQREEVICAFCRFRLIHLAGSGFTTEWIHGFRHIPVAKQP